MKYKHYSIGTLCLLALLVVVGVFLKSTSSQSNLLISTNDKSDLAYFDLNSNTSSGYKDYSIHAPSVDGSTAMVKLNEQSSENLDTTIERAYSKIEDFTYMVEPHRTWFTEWIRDNWGYFSAKDEDAYKDYDNSYLETLGNEGDLLALAVLSDRYFDQEEIPFDKIMEVNQLAAIHGSTEAIKILSASYKGMIAAQLVGAPDTSINELASNPLFIGWLAHYEFAVQRGDVFKKDELNRDLALYNIQITEQVKGIVSREAAQLYRHYETQRKDLGLGAFNNDVPEYVLGYHEELTAVSEARGLRSGLVLNLDAKYYLPRN